MKTGKKLLSVLLSLMLVLGTVALGSMSVSAEQLDPEAILIIGNVIAIQRGEIKQSNGTGWSFSADGNTVTLSLNGLEIESSGVCIDAYNLDLIITGSANLTSTGSNAILAIGCNITLDNNTVIRLQSDSSPAIYADSLTVNGASVYAESTSSHAIFINQVLTVNSGSVYAKSGNSSSIVTIQNIVLNNGEGFTKGDENASEALISVLRGSGTASDPYQISNYAGLKEFASIVNGTNVAIDQNRAACAILTADIVCKNNPDDTDYAADWIPIGNYSNGFTGLFDGKDNNGVSHTITGLTTPSDYDDYAGLFGYIVSGGAVQNVSLSGGVIAGSCDVGGVVGMNQGGTITNCSNMGDTTIATTESGYITNVGGLVGTNLGSVSNCSNTGSVSSGIYAGGVVGVNGGSVSNCSNTGDVTVNEVVNNSIIHAGGVVGVNGGSVSNCSNTGDVTVTSESSDAYVGGVVGQSDSTNISSIRKITNCYNTGSLNVTNDAISYVGGVVGNSRYSSVANCYNTGTVIISGHIVIAGGVAGINKEYPSLITDCRNTGSLTATGYGVNVGGISGNNLGKVTKCCNTGNVTAAGSNYAYAGGTVGGNDKEVTNCYNKGNITATGTENAYAGGSVGRGFAFSSVSNFYNTGSVSAISTATDSKGYAGGVVGYNNNVTNCYNIGNVTASGPETHIGGVAGFNDNNGTIVNCYYDRTMVTIPDASEGNNWKAVGNSIIDTVTGLTTSEMTGEDAFYNMNFYYSGDSSWLTKADGADEASGKYYWFYPHLTGFAYDTEPTVENWPAKTEVTVKVTGGDTLVYDGEAHKVESIIIGDSTVPEGATATYQKYENDEWGDASSAFPEDPGKYEMTVSSGGEVLGTKYFTILQPDTDYTASCYKKIGEDWSADFVTPVDAGEYKAVITFTDTGFGAGKQPIEKEFKINRADITITAANAKFIYDGAAHSYNSVTVTKGALVSGDELVAEATGSVTNVSDTAEGNNIIAYDYKIMNGDTDVTANYAITAVNGTLTVHKRNVTLTSPDKTYIYDGTDHVIGDNEITVGGDGWAHGEGVTYSKTSIKNVGTRPNEFTYTMLAGTRAENYNIEKVEGTLEVTDDGVSPEKVVQLATGDSGAVYNLGDEITYTVTVTNIYDNPETVTLTMPDGIILEQSVFENIVPGDSVNTVARHTVSSEDIIAGNFDTSVKADLGGKSFTVSHSCQSIAAKNAEIGVTVRLSAVNGEAVAPGESVTAKPGDRLAFAGKVTNNGNVPLTDAVARDSLTDTDYNVGTLKPGEVSEDIKAEHIVTAADIAAGKIIESIVVTAEDDEGETVSGDAEVEVSTKTEYKVTYAVDGEELTTMDVAYGQPVPVPRTPQKDGYSFAWTDEIPEKMPAEDITINGSFTLIEYTARFVNEAGETIKEETFTVKSKSITEPEVPGKAGYTGKWSEYTIGASDMTINPVYTPIEYTATFVDENGEVLKEVTFTVESGKLDEPEVPAKEGYDGAWEEYEIGAGNITIKPVYTPANICKLDGEYHGDTFFGKLITFFHNLIWTAFSFIGLDVYFSIKRG